jgi:hypothetical protein
MKQKQTHEYRMTAPVHLSGGYDAELNNIAREAWRIVHVGAGFILWERPFVETETPAAPSDAEPVMLAGGLA